MYTKSEKVYALLRRVPRGKITTYGELAKAAKLHPRTIGMLMKSNQDPVNIPCYKVVRSDGSVGGYSGRGGTKMKIALLERDGIPVKSGRIDLKRHLYVFSRR